MYAIIFWRSDSALGFQIGIQATAVSFMLSRMSCASFYHAATIAE
jgi:hypothetical protein